MSLVKKYQLLTPTFPLAISVPVMDFPVSCLERKNRKTRHGGRRFLGKVTRSCDLDFFDNEIYLIQCRLNQLSLGYRHVPTVNALTIVLESFLGPPEERMVQAGHLRSGEADV